MNTEEFLRSQYLTLRDEIRESKAHIFWILIAGMLLVLAAGYLAAEHPSAFADGVTVGSMPAKPLDGARRRPRPAELIIRAHTGAAGSPRCSR